MPDISALNGTAIDNVAEFDGLTVTAPAFVGLLDETYGSGAAAAFSTRRLASATTVLLRVRRDTGGTGDDDEADVAYDSNNELSLDSAISNASALVTSTTLGQFINVGTVNGTTYTNPDSLTVTASCYVDTWYDQAGSNDAEQTAQGSQPQIHDGTVNTDLIQENGQPALDANRDFFNITDITSISAYSCIAVMSDGINDVAPFGQNTSNGTYITWKSSATAMQFRHGGAPNVNLFLPYALPTSQRLDWYNWTGSTVGFGYNGGALDTASLAGLPEIHVILSGHPTLQLIGKAQEVLIWTSDQESAGNRTGIEVNINNHFAIGNLPNPTSGLLATYTGAAAAYSVRQLANTAALSMRVRRDTAGGTGDDDEADVLFDFTLTDPTISLDSRINNPSAGVASTTLGEFLNATGYTDVDNLTVVADGFCDIWYDQSGAGNDAEQTVFGSQAQIFDSASPTDLIQENGKPALNFDDVGIYNAGNIVTDDITVSIVCTAVNTPTTVGGLLAVQNSINQGYEMVYITQDNGRWAVKNSDLNVTFTEDQQSHVFTSYDGTTQQFAINGTNNTQASSQTFSLSYDLVIGARQTGATGQFWGGTIQEVVVYADATYADTTNRNGIETDIDTYFSIT